jgi:polyisoprenoid-binding protein YceI
MNKKQTSFETISGENMTLKFKQLLMVTVLSISSVFAAEVDLKASSLKWKGTKVSGDHFGKISLKSAKVDLKKGELTGGEFIVDMNSFTTEDLKGEWATKLIGHLKSKDFFVVEKYPTAKLKIKSVKGKKVTADLTIKDKTNEVTFDIKNNAKKYSGILKFDRTKFGMVYGSGDFFKGLGDKMIHNDVTVDFSFVVK